jgi:hypothetical protein
MGGAVQRDARERHRSLIDCRPAIGSLANERGVGFVANRQYDGTDLAWKTPLSVVV